MPLLHFLFHAVTDTAFDPHGVIRLPFVRLCDLVHGQETEAVYPAEGKGLVLYGIQCVVPKFLIDLLYLFGRHLKGRQVCRKVAQGMAPLVGQEDGIQLFTGDPLDLQQAVRVMVQHVKCPCAELLHNQLRRPRPDPLDHAG